MKRNADILHEFPRASFWDVDVSMLSIVADRNFIIPRALFMTTPQTFDTDINKLEDLYSRHQIIHALRTTKERISNKVCELVAKHYHIQPFSRFAR